MKSLVMKRSIVVVGHKTSVSLEDAFWRRLKQIAVERDITVSGSSPPLISAAQTTSETCHRPSAFLCLITIEISPTTWASARLSTS